MNRKKLDNAWLLSLLRTINAGASPDTLFRLFMNEVSASLGLKTVQAFLIDRPGNLVLKHWYGLSEEHAKTYGLFTPDMDLPIIDAYRSKETLILNSSKKILDSYPSASTWDYIPDAVIAHPMTIGEAVEGMLIVTFDRELSDAEVENPEKIEMLQILAELCQLMILRIPSSRNTPTPRKEEPAVTPEVVTFNLVELSDRHKQILCGIAKGLTNAEIGKKMNYSEATVRVEIGKLLAKLQVANRQEAAAIAHRYGC